MTAPKTILLTGGAGYIGSHTYVALAAAGYLPVILDNFSNSHPAVLARLEKLTGKPVICERGSVLDTAFVQQVLQIYGVAAVLHFAGCKSVGESVLQPLKYYNNNVVGMVSLLQAMTAGSCRTLVFSSTATVYGEPDTVPVTENSPLRHTSPYAHSKLVCEEMILATGASDASWRTATLRYFNPVGAHPSALIGEDPTGIPNNLMPYITQVAVGQRLFLMVYGNDYATHDGTGVRDYIHVQDIARGHVLAVDALLSGAGSFTVNLGTGSGQSVLDVVNAFERASGRSIPYKFVPRRRGDVAAYCAEASLARQLLGWTATHSLADMCRDAWRWQQANPSGYAAGD